jgi:hypothetical protein
MMEDEFDEKRTSRIFTGFLLDYSVYYHLVTAVISSPTAPSDKPFITLFKALAQKEKDNFLSGREDVFLDLMHKEKTEPTKKLTWLAKCSKNKKATNNQALVDLLSLLGFERKEIEDLAPMYFENVNVVWRNFDGNTAKQSEHHQTLKEIVENAMK